MKSLFWVYALCGVLLSLAPIAYASSPSEIHITPDGHFTATNVVVMQKAGTKNFFSRVTWGDTFVRLLVLAHDTTTVLKDHGEVSQSNDIQEGDLLDVEGVLAGGGSLTVDASHIRDYALQQATKTLSGTIQSMLSAQTSFILPNKSFGTTVVVVGTTTTITKGARTISFGDLLVGDKILSASGVYTYTTNSLAADTIAVYQDKSVFVPQNFQGTLQSMSATQLPASVTITIQNVQYTAYLSAASSVLNKNKEQTDFSRFKVGDTVRMYGTIRQTNLHEIDASVVRDLAF